MIPKEAMAAVEQAVRKAMEQRTYDRHAYDTEVFAEGVADIAQAALEAAAPYLRAQALEELTANSPRLPREVRDAVFELVFDVANKFHFPMQNCGPHKDVVEAGDVCGDVEKRIVALLRARAATERAQR